jgi:predicted transcriptional regulator
MPRKPVELTKAEWTVIKTIWSAEPCTAPEVQEALFKTTKWSYSTVRTIMDRMVGKGTLRARKDGKTTLFTSAVTPAQAQRGEVLYGLKNAFNGALTPMVQCLLNASELSERDFSELEALIKAKKQARKQSSP